MRAHREAGRRTGERGAVLVIVAICIALLLGLGALAVDVGHLYLSRNELQGAADACALAGAAKLYLEDGSAIDTGANQLGHDAGVLNQSLKTAVEIDWTAGNAGDVERGHYNFTTHGALAARSFTANDSTALVQLWDRTDDALDADTDFINAVRCVARREATPATNFLAPVLGVFGGNFATSIVRAEAVAVVGFAGTLEPGEVNLPIGMCAHQIIDDDDAYTCAAGRMLNNNDQTAMWTTYSQSSCSAPASAVRPLVCRPEGNTGELQLGQVIANTNGVQNSTFSDFRDCWLTGLHRDTNGDGVNDATLDTNGDGWPDVSWEIDLPVIDCLAGGGCTPLVGAVTVHLVWMLDQAQTGGSGAYDEAPRRMDDWTCSIATPTTAAQRHTCWDEFVAHFNLKTGGNATATYTTKSIYFVPDCTPHEPSGRTGGRNFGILAKYPALVR